MVEVQTCHPEPQTSGVRRVPPSVPPAPPAGPPRPPGHGPLPPPPSDLTPGGSVALGGYLVECLGELAFIRATLESREKLKELATPELSLDLWSQIEEVRMRLVQRLQEIDVRMSDGPRELSDRALLGFHRAMLDVSRRGVPDSLLEAIGFGPLVPSAENTVSFRYAPALRSSYDDPAHDSPTAMVRRILDDLENAVSLDDHLDSVESLDQGVSRKLLAVIFACHAGESPLLTVED